MRLRDWTWVVVCGSALGLGGGIGPSRAQTSPPAQQNSALDPKGPLNPGANSFAEGQARALIESKGYSQVSPLMNDPDGIWRGRATKDGRTVEVSVDFKGNVVGK